MNIDKHILAFRLDFLTIYGTFKYEEIFHKLNFTNTASWKFDKFSIFKTEIPRHEYKIVFMYNNHVVFAYEKWEEEYKSHIKSYDKIIIYWTGFKLLSKDEIFTFLSENFILKHCQRIDICLDLNINIEEIFNEFDKSKIPTKRTDINKFKLETIYIWNKGKSNKRSLIRIYDKKRDIEVKSNENIYPEYMIEENVTRIELEIRALYARNISWSSLYDDEVLLWVFKNYVKKYINILDYIEVDTISLLEPYDVDENNFWSLAYLWKNLKVKQFIWRGKSLFESWYAPIKILLTEWFIDPVTRKYIWEKWIAELIADEKRLKQIANSRKYKRKKHLSSNEDKWKK